MSDDEIAVFFVSLVVAAYLTVAFAGSVVQPRLLRRWAGRWVIGLTPLACLAILLVVLRTLAGKDVRASAGYIAGFLVLGLAWLGLVALLLLPTMGISLRDDAIERRNLAAVWAACGAELGAALVYAGANIGEGATIWTTIGPWILASAAWAALWLAAELSAGFAEAVTVERDLASGVRLAAMLVAMGLVLGRAVAGNFVSTGATLHDFLVQGWPAAALAALAAAAQRQLGVGQGLKAGLVPAAGLVAVAAGWVLWLGVPR